MKTKIWGIVIVLTVLLLLVGCKTTGDGAENLSSSEVKGGVSEEVSEVDLSFLDGLSGESRKAAVEAKREGFILAAKASGVALVLAAQKSAEQGESVASNALAKIAAKKAGEKLVADAQKKADDLVAKAVEEGNKLAEAAAKEK